MTGAPHRTPGPLGKRYYVVVAEPTEKAGERHRVLDQHLAWLASIEAAGQLFLAGPFVGEDGASDGGGLFVLRTTNLTEAKALAAGDPYTRDGYRRATVRPWRLDQGSFRLDVSHSRGDHEFD